VKLHRDGDRLLQLLIFNEECLVSASHQLALITSLPFVHTARRSYRLDVLVKRLDWRLAAATLSVAEKFVKPSHLEEGEVVTRFLPLQSTEASAARKGARRDQKTMSGLKELVGRPGRVRRHRQIAGTPTQLTNTKRLADQAPAAGVTTQGTVKAS
jgi:hypothetical protein